MTNQLTPEEAFALAAAEYDGDDARPGLLAMAEAQADGDPQRTRAAYLRLRSAQLLGTPPRSASPTPPVAARPPTPPPPSEAKSSGVAIAVVTMVFLGLAALAFFFVRSDGEAESEVDGTEEIVEAEPMPEPVVVSVDCASTRRRVGGSSPGEILGSAVGSLVDRAAMEAVVTVRNAGAAGEVVVAVAAFSEVQAGALGREQTVPMAAGERRQLTFTFDPTPFNRGGACRAWTAPLGDPLADFDAFVETYNTAPEPRAEPAPESPAPESPAPESPGPESPAPTLTPPAPEPEILPAPEDEPAPPASEPLPRRPEPDPPVDTAPPPPAADGDSRPS